ncbi:MAG: 4Fe-4S dicluster domain-containing protein, partial [Gemmatimonadetes bacterium]|nr:4Fe-4S dicluster domain-containing protein [Gemmatimonadota bacterium]
MSQTPQSTNGAVPPNFAFVIDNRKCIGCHACSVACKSENDVPLSVNRTWVKYVETGLYPDSRRHFQVTRCNHCANPPCVRICPTAAMFQRADGIVEFESDACIGCKACLQACPYDAIYIDPESHTAAKCNYCAHRIEIGLEPACVVVCPEHAIIAGDKNDPGSEIAHLIANEKVTVRKPEQGTKPKLYYIEGTDASLQPDPSIAKPQTYMWADRVSEQGEDPKPLGYRAAGPVAPGHPVLDGARTGSPSGAPPAARTSVDSELHPASSRREEGKRERQEERRGERQEENGTGAEGAGSAIPSSPLARDAAASSGRPGLKGLGGSDASV